jgi:hypothetical protein
LSANTNYYIKESPFFLQVGKCKKFIKLGKTHPL